MRLVSARVQGFQSFSDSGEVTFAEGINLIIGQNNAGKSALLRAFLPYVPDDRHRTSEKWEAHKLPVPLIALTVDVSGAEIQDWSLRSGSAQFIPVRQIGNFEANLREVFDCPSLHLLVRRTPGESFSGPYPSHQLFNFNAGQQHICALVQPSNGELATNAQYRSDDSLPGLLWGAWHRDMFYFAAERMTIGEANSGYADRLAPNAANLPNVLHTLASERGDVFRRLVLHMRDVFSTVGNLSVRTKPDNNVLEVRVWPTSAMERVELSVPLNSSGTGVSQVIALLTAIMTLDNAIIIIDEINSFLHPAAVKNLLRILQAHYTNHQYIISTHAPEVIGFGNPKTIHLVKRSGYDSSVEKLDLTEVGKFREVADHLGVSMADVFAAERVIWVEGPTEELCFPYIYQQLVGPLPRGTVVTAVAATGDFNAKKRDRAMVYEVYSRLSAASATLVVSVAFSFDTEKLTEDEKAGMQRDSGGLLHFLPRRHLECYLLDPGAIAAFIISKDSASSETVTFQAVEVALQVAAAEHPFLIKQWKGEIADPEWLVNVDAANLLVQVCGVLSDQRAPFGKKDDSLFLLRHILEHNSEKLEPLRDYVESLVRAVAPK